MRALRPLIMLLGLAFLLVLPWAPFVPYSVIGRVNQAAILTLVAASLVLLTGWAGQISLGHAGLVGVGAYTAGWMTAGLGIPFPLNVPAAAGAAGAVAALLGGVAVRVRGLYLAVATLIFSWVADAFLFRLDWFTKHSTISGQRAVRPGEIPSFDLTDRRYFYYLVWAFAIAGLYAVANIRDSKTGRALFAVRGSEMAAASLGISVVRYKLLAFVVSGTMAGVAGALVLTGSLAVTPTQFGFNVSLIYLAILVVAGIGSLPGAVAAALVFASLEEVFFRVKALEGFLEVASAGLLVAVLHAAPGGLGAALASVKRGLLRVAPFWERPPKPNDTGHEETPDPKQEVPVRKRVMGARVKRVLLSLPFAPRSKPVTSNGSSNPQSIADLEGPPDTPVSNGSSGHDRDLEWTEGPLIKAEGLTVRFGGLTAVSDVSLEVRKGQIVGLIGPNGAGKTTCFNAISGLVIPTDGKVSLFGKDVTKLTVHERASMGLARTFQVLQLFSQLTVFQNLLVAGHCQDPTGVLSHLIATTKALKAEENNRYRVREVISKLGLEEVADRPVAGLPFGILRLVEIGRALVTGAPAIMLDETASGLDDHETDRLIETLYSIRDSGISMLLIEHDVRMVTQVSDYMYVLDQGKLIAQGTPEAIRQDPVVVAAYLGEPAKEAVG